MNASYTPEVEAGKYRGKEPVREPDNAAGAATLFLILILLVIMTMGNGLF